MEGGNELANEIGGAILGHADKLQTNQVAEDMASWGGAEAHPN